MLRRIEEASITVVGPLPMHVPIVERAFKLAATGSFHDPGEIAQQLESEGYLDVQEHIRDSPLLRRQLREAARQGRQA